MCHARTYSMCCDSTILIVISIDVRSRNKEVLLTLLEAFVYDPLVDWTADKYAATQYGTDITSRADPEKKERRNVELNVSLTLLASRVDEIKAPLKEVHQQLISFLPALSSQIQALIVAGKEKIEAESVHISLQENIQLLHAKLLESARKDEEVR